METRTQPRRIAIQRTAQSAKLGCSRLTEHLGSRCESAGRFFAVLFWNLGINSFQQDGTFIMYYSATTNSDRSKHCVGAATSKHVRGPYTPVGDKPLFCPLEAGGAIDASGYNDHGKRYIVYKIDGNSMGHGGPCGNTGMILK